jgi:hypothetical protein
MLLEKNFLDDAVSRAYYAVFHAMVALLKKNKVNLDIHKHTYILRQFRIHFIDTGIFRNETLKKVIQIKKAREQSDYSAAMGIDLEQATRLVEDAQSVISQIQALLDRASQ